MTPMFLQLLVYLGLLYIVSGALLKVVYWGEMPSPVTAAFFSLGAGIFTIANNFWWFAGWSAGELLLYLGALFLFLGWVAAMVAVRAYLTQQRLLLEYQRNDE